MGNKEDGSQDSRKQLATDQLREALAEIIEDYNSENLPPDEPGWFSAREIGDELGISADNAYHWLRRMVDRGKYRIQKIGMNVYFKRIEE